MNSHLDSTNYSASRHGRPPATHVEKPGLFHPFTVAQSRIENPKVRTLIFDRPLAHCEPGQFVMTWLPGEGEKPFSITQDDPFAITVADVGAVSHSISQLQPGQKLWVRGPLGQGFAPAGKRHILVGGGYGAAPLSFLATRLLRDEGEVRVCLGARGADDLLLVDHLRAMGCSVAVATEDGSAGTSGLVTALVEAEISRGAEHLYACGPMGMLLAVWEQADAAGFPAQLSFEAIVRCGIGLCGSCELPENICQKVGIAPGWLVCQDGPVARIGR